MESLSYSSSNSSSTMTQHGEDVGSGTKKPVAVVDPTEHTEEPSMSSFSAEDPPVITEYREDEHRNSNWSSPPKIHPLDGRENSPSSEEEGEDAKPIPEVDRFALFECKDAYDRVIAELQSHDHVLQYVDSPYKHPKFEKKQAFDKVLQELASHDHVLQQVDSPYKRVHFDKKQAMDKVLHQLVTQGAVLQTVADSPYKRQPFQKKQAFDKVLAELVSHDHVLCQHPRPDFDEHNRGDFFHLHSPDIENEFCNLALETTTDEDQFHPELVVSFDSADPDWRCEGFFLDDQQQDKSIHLKSQPVPLPAELQVIMDNLEYNAKWKQVFNTVLDEIVTFPGLAEYRKQRVTQAKQVQRTVFLRGMGHLVLLICTLLAFLKANSMMSVNSHPPKNDDVPASVKEADEHLSFRLNLIDFVYGLED